MPHSETALTSIIRTIILCCSQTHQRQVMKVQVKVHSAEQKALLLVFLNLQLNLD